MRRDAWAGLLSWWSCQSPVTHRYGLLNHLTGFYRGMFKLHAEVNTESVLYLLTHSEWNTHTGHMLTQRCLPSPLTSTVKSSLFRCAYSSPPFWLPGYIEVVQTILIILTMAGLYLDRSHIYSGILFIYKKDEILPFPQHGWILRELC